MKVCFRGGGEEEERRKRLEYDLEHQRLEAEERKIFLELLKKNM